MAPTQGVHAPRWLLARLPLLGVAMLAFLPTAANAQANCDWYGRTAVRQQQINEEKKCGFQGDAWHKDLGAHVKWCASVAPDVWKLQAQGRNSQLEACEKKQGG